MRDEILEVKHLSLKIGKAHLLEDINFSMQRGEIICILGRNGAGKSTLLKSILNLYSYSGYIGIDGINLQNLSARERANKIAYVPQSSHIIFPFKVIEVVMMGRFAKQAWFYTQADKRRAYEMLERFEMAHLSERIFSSLSGGQQQLALIARAFAQECELLLLDEPVSALDLSRCFTLLEIVRHCGKSVLLTSHHPEQCGIAHKILMMKDAKMLAFGERTAVLNTDMIERLYDVRTEAVPLPNGGIYFVAKCAL